MSDRPVGPIGQIGRIGPIGRRAAGFPSYLSYLSYRSYLSYLSYLSYPSSLSYRLPMTSRPLLRPFEALLLAAWFGGGLFLIVAASAAFSAAGNATTAAAVVGAMLSRWHYLALGAPLILLLLEWSARSLANTARVVLLALALLAASGQAGVDLRIHAMRAQSRTPISQRARTDPVRRAFGRLHGISMTLLALQVLLAAAVVAADQPSARRDTERPSMS